VLTIGESRKGIGLIFPNLDREIVFLETNAVTQTCSEMFP